MPGFSRTHRDGLGVRNPPSLSWSFLPGVPCFQPCSSHTAVAIRISLYTLFICFGKISELLSNHNYKYNFNICSLFRKRSQCLAICCDIVVSKHCFVTKKNSVIRQRSYSHRFHRTQYSVHEAGCALRGRTLQIQVVETLIQFPLHQSSM